MGFMGFIIDDIDNISTKVLQEMMKQDPMMTMEDIQNIAMFMHLMKVELEKLILILYEKE